MSANAKARLPRPLPAFEEGCFNLGGLRWLSFDLDHTLARYKHEPTSELIYTSLIKYLVRHCGYPRTLLDFHYDPTFITKGVVCDTTTGNFITVDADKRVTGRRLFHGTQERVFGAAGEDDADVPPAVLAPHIYPGPISEFDPLASSNPGQSERFHSFITYFDIPAGHLYAKMVSLKDHVLSLRLGSDVEELAKHSALTPVEIDAAERAEESVNPHWYAHEQAGNRKLLPAGSDGGIAELSPEQKAAEVLSWAQRSYRQLWTDMIAGFRHNFGDCNRGYYFPVFFRSPEKFIYRRPDLKQWLWRLRNLFGKKLLLITNSRQQYAHCLLQYMFDTPEWDAYFDLTVVWGRKPGFWTGSHPFVRVVTYRDLSQEQVAQTQREFREKVGDPEAECFFYPQMGCQIDLVVQEIVLPKLVVDPATPANPAEAGPAGPIVGIGNYTTLQRLLFPNCPQVRATAEDLCRPDEVPQIPNLGSGEDISAGHISKPGAGSEGEKLDENREHHDDEEKHEEGVPLPGMDAGTAYLRKPHRCAMIYFGDNLRTDVMAVKLYTTWLAGAILEECQEVWPAQMSRQLASEQAAGDVQLPPADARELPVVDFGFHGPEDNQGGQAAIAECSWVQPKQLRPIAAADAALQVRAQAELYHPVQVNPNWGSFFLAGSGNTRVAYWNDFVMRHAHVCVTDVTDFIDVRPLVAGDGRLPDRLDVPLQYRQPEEHCYWPTLAALQPYSEDPKAAAEPKFKATRRASLAVVAEAGRVLRNQLHLWQPQQP